MSDLFGNLTANMDAVSALVIGGVVLLLALLARKPGKPGRRTTD